MFKGVLRARKVTLVGPDKNEDVRVRPDFECRSCYASKVMRPTMKEYGCIAESDMVHACR